MVQDARRYLPCAAEFEHRGSLFEVKTVMVKNERDDGRPILLCRHADAPRLSSVMGAKIDNIYDLFEALPQLDPRWRTPARTGCSPDPAAEPLRPIKAGRRPRRRAAEELAGTA